jgi:pimeloyl-ACP methyl ester carboxylesterase
MPWVDIVSSSSWQAIWYTCNSITGHTTSFDPAKPTILMLHPWLLDSTWMREQWDDPVLNECYNLIIPDMRCQGNSKSSPTGLSDIWVNAADLAFMHHVSIYSRSVGPSASETIPCMLIFLLTQRLGLSPVHIFAAETVGTCEYWFR